MDATLMVAISAALPLLFERMKGWDWCPIMLRDYAKYAPIVNRLTPLVVGFLTAIGITFNWDPAAGTFTIGGLLPDQLARAVVLTLLGWGTNQGVYHGLVRRR